MQMKSDRKRERKRLKVMKERRGGRGKVLF
jgi:hypothetical protein